MQVNGDKSVKSQAVNQMENLHNPKEGKFTIIFSAIQSAFGSHF